MSIDNYHNFFIKVFKNLNFMIMKTKKNLCALAFICLIFPLFGGNIENDQKNKEPIQVWCWIQGNPQLIADSNGGTIIVCHFVSNSQCIKARCSDLWPTNLINGQFEEAVYPGLEIEDTQPFFAYYDENNDLVVRLVDNIDFISDNQDSTVFYAH